MDMKPNKLDYFGFNDKSKYYGYVMANIEHGILEPRYYKTLHIKVLPVWFCCAPVIGDGFADV